MIQDKHIGLITMIEVINEEYVFDKYSSKEGNLYKPDGIGTAMQYKGDSIEAYKGIFNNAKTVKTDDEDKKRLIAIFKKIKEAKTTEEIEENFIDFDRIIRSVAINKAIGNVDNFVGRTRRNFYIYEENGKIDIIPFDFNISFGMYPEEMSFTEEDVKDIELSEYQYQVHSIIVELIMENEEYLKKYNQYLQETINIIAEMNEQGVLDEIENNVSEIIKSTENEFYTYEEHKIEVEKVKDFIENRVNMIQAQDK